LPSICCKTDVFTHKFLCAVYSKYNHFREPLKTINFPASFFCGHFL
jgi:hypothetical protein